MGSKQNSIICFYPDKCIRIYFLSNSLPFPLSLNGADQFPHSLIVVWEILVAVCGILLSISELLWKSLQYKVPQHSFQGDGDFYFFFPGWRSS